MFEKITPKSALLCIKDIRPQVVSYYRTQNRYPEIVAFLSQAHYFKNSREELTFADMAKITGLSVGQLGKQFVKMYEELFEEEAPFSFSFPETEIIFSVTYLKKNIRFKMQGIERLPMQGEQLHLFFLRAHFGIDLFYVADIDHTFRKNKQCILFTIHGGIYNAYWEYEKAKALEQQTLDFIDLHSKYEFEVKEIVYKRNR